MGGRCTNTYLLDGDVSHSPSLPAVSGDQIASSAVEAKGLTVVWIGDVHEDSCIEVMVLWDCSAIDRLALHGCVKVRSAHVPSS